MIWTLGGWVLGALTGWCWWRGGRGAMEGAPLARTNHRGAVIPTAVGIVVPLAVLSLGAAATVLVAARPSLDGEWFALASVATVTATGFALLGLFDDVVGVGQSDGFRGHLRALAAGRLTSGAIKLIGGAAVGVVVAALLPAADTGGPLAVAVVRDGAIVALAANLVNLFDRRPGRALKVATVVFVAAAVVARSPALSMPAIGLGAGLALLRPDLRERCMLGDTGANSLGGLCGVALLVAAPSGPARWWILAVLVLLNASSERFSFSRVIDSVPPLRWFDRLGAVRSE